MKRKGIFAVFLILVAGLGAFYIIKKRIPPSSPALAQEKKALYHCPMHPSYTSDKPGDCPICGMKLVPVAEEERETHEDSQAPVPGEIRISPEREQLIGVKTSKAEVLNLTKVVRASARVAYDIELYNAIAEYKEALSSKRNLTQSPLPDVQEGSSSLVRASRLKLRQLGFSEGQINDLGRGGGGSQSNLLLGEGGKIWIYAQIYEFEAGLVRPGQTMEVTAPALPGRKFHGVVKAVDPILSVESRSLKVRAEVPNKEGLLRPEMYVDAKIIVDLGKKLAVPEEAIMDTGERKLAFVLTAPGKYVPREVVTGQEAEGYYEIVEGLREGETVVTSANFLIDSESRLKSAVSGAAHKH